jgi:hypothetical protein
LSTTQAEFSSSRRFRFRFTLVLGAIRPTTYMFMGVLLPSAKHCILYSLHHDRCAHNVVGQFGASNRKLSYRALVCAQALCFYARVHHENRHNTRACFLHLCLYGSGGVTTASSYVVAFGTRHSAPNGSAGFYTETGLPEERCTAATLMAPSHRASTNNVEHIEYKADQ